MAAEHEEQQRAHAEQDTRQRLEACFTEMQRTNEKTIQQMMEGRLHVFWK